MFKDPVFTESGNTYERSAINHYWKQQGERRDPLHNTLLKSATLKTNWDKRRDVEEFLQEWPDYVPEGWSSRDAAQLHLEENTKAIQPGRLGSGQHQDRGSQTKICRPCEVVIFTCCILAIWYWLSSLRPSEPLAQVKFIPADGGAVRNVTVLTVARELSQMTAKELLAVMDVNMHEVEVQRHGCLRLQKLAADYKNHARIAAMGGVQRTLNALQAYQSDEEVQANGCATLWNLAHDSGNQALILSNGGLKVIESALVSHPASAKVQRSGCGALWNLASMPYNARQIASTTLVERVVEAMRHHPHAQDVNQHACGALWNLAIQNEIHARVDSLGGRQLLHNAIRTHKATEPKWYCCGALRDLFGKPARASGDPADVEGLCSESGRGSREVEL
jgi:hypothetical protein